MMVFEFHVIFVKFGGGNLMQKCSRDVPDDRASYAYEIYIDHDDARPDNVIPSLTNPYVTSIY